MIKKIIFTGSLVFIAGLVGVILFRTAVPSIKNRIISETKTHTGFNLKFDDFKLKFPGKVYAHNITLMNTDGDVLLKAKEFRAGITLIKLLNSHFCISSLFIDGLIVEYGLVESLGNSKNDKKYDKNKQWKFSLNNAKLKHTVFNYNDSSHRINIEDLNFSYLSAGNFSFLGENIFISKNEESINIEHLNVTGITQSDSLKLDRIALDLTDFTINGNLNFEKADPGKITGEFHSSGQIKRPAQVMNYFLIQAIPSVQGYADIELKINGSLHNPEFYVKSDFKNLGYGGYEFSSGIVKGDFINGTVTLDRFNIEDSYGGRANFKGEYRVKTQKLRIRGEIKDAVFGETVTLLDKVSYLAGKEVNSSFNFSGNINEPQTWSGEASGILKMEQEKVNAVLEFKNGSGNFNVTLKENGVYGSGNYSENIFTGNIKADIGNIEDILKYTDYKDITGKLKAEGSFRGNIKDLKMEVVIKTAHLFYNRLPVEISGGEFILDDGRVFFRDIAAAGKFEMEDKEIITDRVPDIRGNLEYSCMLEGNIEDPTAVFEVKIASPGAKNFSGDRLNATVEYSAGEPYLNFLDIRKKNYILLSTTKWPFMDKTGEVTLETYTFNENRHHIIKKDSKSKVEGLIPVGQSRVTYDIENPEYVKLNIEEEGLSLEAVDKFFDMPFSVSGTAGGRANFKGNMKNPEIDLNLFFKDVKYSKHQISRAQGILKLKDEQLTVEAFQIETPQNGLVRGDFSFKIMDWEEFDFTPDTDHYSEGKVHLENLELALMNPFLGQNIFRDGTARADLDWAGILKHPSVKGQIELDHFSVITDRTGKIENLNLKAIFKEDTAQIERFSVPAGAKTMNLRGTVKYPGKNNYEWDLYVEMEKREKANLSGILENGTITASNKIDGFNLSDISEYIPGFTDPEGEITGEVRLNGSVEDPNIFGSLKVRKFGGAVRGLKEPFRNGNINVLFDKNEIEIRRFKAGALAGYGKIIIEDRKLKAVDIESSIDNMKMKLDNLGNGKIEKANIYIKGEDDNFVLGGDIDLEEFFITIEEPAGPSRETDKSEILEKISIDLTLQSGSSLWVYNRHGRIRLDGELSISGTAKNPNFRGRLFTDEGYVMYLDRKFNISEGYVDMDSRIEDVPYINIEAYTRVRSLREADNIPYNINITAHGPVNNIQVDLTSQPSLDVSDIVALLTFGATRGQLTETERILSSRAEELASRRVSGYISAYAGNMLNLDRMIIDGNIFRTGTQDGPRIQAQKDISENIALAYVGDLSAEDSAIVATRTTGRAEIIYTEGLARTDRQKLQLRYSLTPNISVEALTDQSGRSNIGLKYSIWKP